MRQYVSVQFSAGGRTYTYHNDGEAVAVGETVRVPGRDGWSRAEVVKVSDQAPAFPTKPIEGKAP